MWSPRTTCLKGDCTAHDFDLQKASYRLWHDSCEIMSSQGGARAPWRLLPERTGTWATKRLPAADSGVCSRKKCCSAGVIDLRTGAFRPGEDRDRAAVRSSAQSVNVIESSSHVRVSVDAPSSRAGAKSELPAHSPPSSG